MTEYVCNVCNKTYIKKHAYDKHITYCKDTSGDIIMTQPLSSTYKKKTIPKALKIKVWNKYIGEEIGKAKCCCCELTDITQSKFHCGHILSEVNGGELHIDNLKPICESCNKSMGVTNMVDFKKQLISNDMTVDTTANTINDKLNSIIKQYNDIYNHVMQRRVDLNISDRSSGYELIISGFDSSNNIDLDTHRIFLDTYVRNQIKMEPHEYKTISLMDKNTFISTIIKLF